MNDWTCPRCGQAVPSAKRTQHLLTKNCFTRLAEKKLLGQGWLPCGSNSRLFKTIDIPVEYLPRISKGLVEAPWAPAWAVSLAKLPYATKRRKRTALKRALKDAELRDAALAALALGSLEAAIHILTEGERPEQGSRESRSL